MWLKTKTHEVNLESLQLKGLNIWKPDKWKKNDTKPNNAKTKNKAQKSESLKSRNQIMPKPKTKPIPKISKPKISKPKIKKVKTLKHKNQKILKIWKQKYQCLEAKNQKPSTWTMDPPQDRKQIISSDGMNLGS